MKNRKIIIASLVCMLALAQVLPVGADTIDELKEKKAQTSQQLDDLEGSIDSLEEKKIAITNEIESLDADLITTIASIDSLAAQIEAKEAEIRETTAALADAEARKETQYKAMKKRIQYIYEHGGDAGWATLLVSEENLTELLNQAEYTQKMYKYDRECLEEYAAIVEEVRALKEQQEDQKAEFEAMKAEEEAEKANLEQLLAQKRETSANYDAELANAREKAEEYRALIDEQNRKIQQLIEEQEAAARAAAAAAAAAAANAGTSVPGNGSGSQIVNYALQFVGNPYVWGGNSLTNGTDCSGFVHLVYGHFGYAVPRQSAALRSVGRAVSYAEAQPGDIICYSGHVAIYMGGGRIVHAASRRTGIIVGNNPAYRTILAVRRIV